MGKAIGIDLGTTYTCVAVFDKGRVDIIPNEQGRKTTPSVVAFTNRTRLVGTSAVQQEHRNPANTISAVKRLMGRRLSDPEVQDCIKSFPYKVIDRDGQPFIKVDYRQETRIFSPQEISCTILQRIMKFASDFQKGEQINEAVITVPAYFKNVQREATIEAGRIAGLRVLKIINEPTAAALAYGYDRDLKDQTLLVFDLGGGTLDVSILKIKDKYTYDVKAVRGDSHLGGIDFDNRMVDYFMKRIPAKHKIVDEDKLIEMRIKLRQECEIVKQTLSVSSSADIYVRSLFPDGSDFSNSITREKFQSECADLFEKCLTPIREALEDAKMDVKMIDDILLIGGSTRMPKIRTMVSEFFGGKPLSQNIHPEEAVAYGAAIEAAVLSSKAEAKPIKLLDVTPSALGIRIRTDDMSIIIPRNTRIPCNYSGVYTTEYDNEEEEEIDVYEGDEEKTHNNRRLGFFTLYNIRRAPKGVPQLLVTFDLDSNGILKVSAVDKASKSANSAIIPVRSLTGSMREKDVEQKKKEQEAFSQQDAAYAIRKDVTNSVRDYLEKAFEALEVESSSDNFTNPIEKPQQSEIQTKVNLMRFIDDGLSLIEKNPDNNFEAILKLREEAQNKLKGYVLLDKYNKYVDQIDLNKN